MTPEQEKKMADALGDGSDLPSLTNDPEVNYEIDRKVCDESMVPWNETTQEDRDDYIEEVELVFGAATRAIRIDL